MESVHSLYVTYEKYIFRYLYSLTLDYYQAEELTQETFLQVVSGKRTLAGSRFPAPAAALI